MTEKDSSDLITPGERRELRAVVRSQMKVLRTEVEQRRAELIAEADVVVAEKYREQNRLADELQRQLRDIADEANRQLGDLLGQYGDLMTGQWQQYSRSQFEAPHIRRADRGRADFREALVHGIEAQCKAAKLALDRQEADLLRDLAVDALETPAARAFIGRIPSVGELVPSRRLREIEAEFDAKAGAQ